MLTAPPVPVPEAARPPTPTPPDVATLREQVRQQVMADIDAYHAHGHQRRVLERRIAAALAAIYEQRLWVGSPYRDFYDYCRHVFGIKRGWASGLLTLARGGRKRRGAAAAKAPPQTGQVEHSPENSATTLDSQLRLNLDPPAAFCAAFYGDVKAARSDLAVIHTALLTPQPNASAAWRDAHLEVQHLRRHLTRALDVMFPGDVPTGAGR